MADSLRALITESLAVVRWEAPPLWDRLGQRLAGLTLDLALEGERFAVRAAAGDVRVGAPDPGAPVRLETDRATIAALLAGQTTLADAVEADRLQLFGTLEDLRRLLAGLHVYLHAAVRAPGFGPLQARFAALEPAGTSRPG
ncbi:MAG: hypothetical protein R3F60_02625 [bacterium]